MSLNMRKPAFGVFDHASLKPACSVTEISKNAEICVYSKFINYTFQRLNNKVADQTARPRRLVCAFVAEMQLP